MGEPTAPSAGDKIFGDGFVLNTSDVTEDAVKELEGQGYPLSVETDDGFSVFRVTGERQTENEDLVALDPVVGDDDTGSDLVPSTGDPVILKGERAKPLEWRWKIICSEDYLKDEVDKTFYVPGTDQEVFVEIIIYIAADRNSEQQTGFVMKVHQATVTVHNSKNEPTHRGYFLTQLQVTASPKLDIAKTVAPDVSDGSGDTISKQKSFTTNFTANLATSGPSGGAGYSSNRGATSNRRYHSWGVEKDGRRRLTWTWRLEHWEDGQRFDVEAPAKVRVKNRFKSPVLPELPPRFSMIEENKKMQIILPPSCEAEWLVGNDKLEGVKNFEWDVEVKFRCASVQVRKIKLIDTQVEAFYFVPAKFHPLKKVIGLPLADC